MLLFPGYAFNVVPYGTLSSLTGDPAVAYFSYFGESRKDKDSCIAVSSYGFTYVAGTTN